MPGPIEAHLRLAGVHNAANAACVATAAAALGLDAAEITNGLGSFVGVGRRFDVKGETAGVLIIDDYGHWQGARKAVDQYIAENHLRLYLARVDYTGRVAVKVDGQK